MANKKKKYNPLFDNIKKYIRKKIINFFYKIGIDIDIAKPDPLLQILKTHKINLVFDVGASTGGFATRILEKNYKGKLISFEPLSSVYPKLVKNSRKYPNWKVYERCAIGEKDGETTINISYNSVSSSILPILETITKIKPFTRYRGSEKVKMYKLDTILPKIIKPEDRVFLKMDAQGYENYILNGASKILPRIDGIMLECSLIKLYEGELLFEKMLKRVENLGFKLYEIAEGFRYPKTGRLYQIDCVFMRK